MISLIITLFICLFSVCPTNSQVVDHTENNIKRSIDLWETGDNELVLSQGYCTNYQELACSETWQKMEEVFSNIWSDFTNDYGGWVASQTIPCSGLYVQLPVYFTSDSGYTTYYNYASNNYSNYYIDDILIYNRRFTANYFQHAVDFHFGNGRYTLEFMFYKSFAGANQCSYSLDVMLYELNVNGYIRYDTREFCLFATNTFTYGSVFFVSDYWALTEEARMNYQDGYNVGYNIGVETGKTAGETTGYGNGYQDGYQEGLAHADYDSTALTIMQGIIDVGLLPVNVFLMILNFEVFGVNISGFVSALLTISIVIIIVRFLFGGKSDGK